MSAAILFGSMAVMIGFGIPIAIVLGVSSALTLIFSGAPLGVIPSMMQATVQKFSLLTIPLFVLAGAIMDKGGISKRLINLADSIIGPVHGGLVVKGALGHRVIGMPEHYHHGFFIFFLFSISGHTAAKPQSSGHDSRQHKYI